MQTSCYKHSKERNTLITFFLEISAFSSNNIKYTSRIFRSLPLEEIWRTWLLSTIKLNPFAVTWRTASLSNLTMERSKTTALNISSLTWWGYETWRMCGHISCKISSFKSSKITKFSGKRAEPSMKTVCLMSASTMTEKSTIKERKRPEVRDF